MSGITSRKHLQRDQNGMAAILITMVMMIVISLIVLGFAKVAQREQRESLDRQLSTQAFYAAESGVNAAISFYVSHPVGAATKTSCQPTTAPDPYAGLTVNNLDTAGNVAVTCLLIDPTPASLSYGSVGATSQVVPLVSAGLPINSIKFTWQATTIPPSPTFTTGPNPNCGGGAGTPLAPATGGSPSWNTSCGAGLLRVDMAAGAATTRSTLLNEEMTAFLYPTASPGGSAATTFNVPNPPGNPLVPTTCVLVPQPLCTMVIKNLLPAATNTWYVRLESLYSNSNVTIQAYNSNDATGSPLSLANSQLEIDATGRASDVVRRIQVRKSLVTSGTAVPDDTIESTGSICKRFSDYSGVAPTVDSTYSDPACQIP